MHLPGQNYPRIVHHSQLIGADRASTLAEGLLDQFGPELVGTPEYQRYNHPIGILDILNRGLSTDSVASFCAEVCPVSDELLTDTVKLAVTTMSGLRPWGNLPGMDPQYLGLRVNYYEPNEVFPTHRDNGMQHDAVLVSLSGTAEFMALKNNAVIDQMPKPTEVLHSWEMTEGGAVSIRNHQTRDWSDFGHQPHAVQNGPEPRLVLEVGVYYSPRW